ncbi:hypothetical protein SNE40_021648 [Patella caerulea]|uniref:Carboxylic ester hydrolase n=1 Tax=Patella caerulea TaxID=87958 RepID=A0AAN8G4J5_PATCE
MNIHSAISRLTRLTVLFAVIFMKFGQCAFDTRFRITARPTIGDVEGFTQPSQYMEKPNLWTNIFLGIPYARRPEQYDDFKRDFRFKKPDNPSWTGTWDATFYRPSCPQQTWLIRETLPGYSDTSEDCLYLNIFAPNIKNEGISTNPPLYPVLVFIHGGGWIMGSSVQYPAMLIAERLVVVVTINYRLNALGFLSTGDVNSPGNYGLWDQLKALEFVKQHIAAFRGNPYKITLMGQSTGAASVGHHIVSPRNVDLFQRAIMSSGSDLSEWSVIPKADSIKYAKALAYEVGCPVSEMERLMDCLKYYRTYDEIVNASMRVSLLRGSVGNPWGPVVDGQLVGVDYAFLPDHPSDIRLQGRFKRIPIICGLVLHEGSFFIPNLPNLLDGVTPSQFENIVREFLYDRSAKDMITTSDAVEFEYTHWPDPKNFTHVREMLIKLLSDFMVGTGTNEVLNSHVIFNTAYSYVFKYRSWNDYLPPWRGVAMGQDLQYIFGFPFWNETYTNMTGLYPRQEYDYSDRNISQYMINLITNFTARGDPTPRDLPLFEFRNSSWISYNLQNHSYLSITNKSENLTNFRQQEYAFWREYFPRVSGRDFYSGLSAPSEEIEKTSHYEKATWSLTAAAVLLCIVLISLFIVMCCRARKKDYI